MAQHCMEGMGKEKLYFPLLKFFLTFFIELKTGFTMSFKNNH